MKRSHTQSLGQVIRDYVAEMNIGRKLKEINLSGDWEELLGKTISRYTRKVYLSKGILYVEISSAVVKAELIMMREDIRRRMNEKAGEEIVLKIVFK